MTTPAHPPGSAAWLRALADSTEKLANALFAEPDDVAWEEVAGLRAAADALDNAQLGIGLLQRNMADCAEIVLGRQIVDASYADIKRSLEELQADKARLDWLIKQGPPGAADGQGLNEEVWDVAATMVSDEVQTDAIAVRAAIDAAKEAK